MFLGKQHFVKTFFVIRTVTFMKQKLSKGSLARQLVVSIYQNESLLLKALANEDTLLRTHCCRHKCFPVCPRAQLCCGHKFCVRDTGNVSDFVQKHFVSATNVSQFAQPKKHHEQQCVRNNVSSFIKALAQGWIQGFFFFFPANAVNVFGAETTGLAPFSEQVLCIGASSLHWPMHLVLYFHICSRSGQTFCTNSTVFLLDHCMKYPAWRTMKISDSGCPSGRILAHHT